MIFLAALIPWLVGLGVAVTIMLSLFWVFDRAGLVTYLDVATAQTDALTHERTAVELQSARLAAAINLVKALGWTWQ